MIKKAYTLIELIFVIVIIGILSGVGFYYFKPHYLQNDYDFVKLKLNTVRYEGLNYDKRVPSETMNYSIGCIAKDDLLSADGTIDKHYKAHALLTLTPDESVLCFDVFGRLYNGTDGNKTTQSSRLSQNLIIQLNYNNEEKNITIDCLSGYLR